LWERFLTAIKLFLDKPLISRQRYPRVPTSQLSSFPASWLSGHPAILMLVIEL